MKPLRNVRFRRCATVWLPSAALLCFFVLAPVETALARTRPPVEMGDPDGSGKPGPGPNGASVIVASGAGSAAQEGLRRVSLRAILALWFWSRVLVHTRQ